MRSRLAMALAVACLALGGVAMAAEPLATDKRHIEIPAQRLGAALQALAKDRGFQVIYVSREINRHRTQGASGELSSEEALKALLAGTGLTFRYLGENSVSILPVDAAGSMDETDEASPTARDRAGVRSGSSGDALTLDVVLVTASKREENIRRVPMSVSVVGEAELESQSASRLTDFAPYVPGLQVNSGGSPGQSQILLRGVADLGPGATVGTYIDEVPMGSSGNFARQTRFALDLLPYDIERVEVLRGPQGTLYGASTMGGMLKYVTKKPDLSDTEFRVGAGLASIKGGDDPGWSARVAANIPLVDERLAIRASYARNEVAGYVDNARTGEEGINAVDQQSARVSLLWKPTDALSLNLTAMQQKIDSDGNGSISLDLVTLKPEAGDLKNRLFVDEVFAKDIDLYTATLDWDLGWGDFTSATGYTTVDTLQVGDSTPNYGPALPFFGFPPGVTPFNLMLDMKKWTQEFRLASKNDGRLQWLVGAFFTGEDTTQRQYLGAYDFDGNPIPVAHPFADINLMSTYDERALFGNLTYRFTDRFDVSAGLRFARNEQDFHELDSGLLVGNVDLASRSTDSVATWMVSPRFFVSDDVMWYGRVATGYRPGGPNVVDGVDAVPPVDADTLISYEIGVKASLLDGYVVLDAAAFYIDWEDIQVLGQGQFGTYLLNGGTAESKGMEGSVRFRLSDGLSLTFAGAYIDARLTQDVPGISGKDGDRLPSIPKLSGSAMLEYFAPLRKEWGLRVAGGYRYVGSRLADVSSSPYAFPLDNYQAFDLNADISNAKWTFRAYVRNLTDERAYLSYGIFRNAVNRQTAQIRSPVVQPRTIGFEIDYRF